MKIKKILISILIFLVIIGISNISTAMTYYQTVDSSTGIVTASALNVRQGPNTNFKVNTIIYKNEYVRVFAKIGDWYVIQTNADYVGMVSSKYIKLIYGDNSSAKSNDNTNTEQNLTSAITRR